MKQLLIGCGHDRRKKIKTPGTDWNPEWDDLYTLDNNSTCKPDLLCDLNSRDWPVYDLGFTSKISECTDESRGPTRYLRSDFFDEVHAYEVLEHLGSQGDTAAFFSTFFNLYRILVPGGLLFATTPCRFSGWLWGDPGHTRAIIPETLSFLDKTNYEECGRTTRSDYRSLWAGDFKCLHSSDADKQTHTFILQAVKPAREVMTFTEKQYQDFNE